MKLALDRTLRLALLLMAAAPPAGAQFLGEKPEAQDLLGSALATGDWNGDGLADLAIGVPGESHTIITFPPPSTSYPKSGGVHVLYGGVEPIDGLLGGGKLLRQGPATGSQPGIAAGNSFGVALAAGDFDQDGFDDLAIGIPGQKINGFSGAGAVQIVRGSPQGLNPHDAVYLSQDSYGIGDQAEASDGFGTSLCAGDFNDDGFDDLAVGVPGERIGSASKAGAVNVIHGSAFGWVKPKNSFWTQGPGLHDSAEAGDMFGLSLAAGDLNGDGFDDLAVGVPREGLLHARDGAVGVIYGSLAGLLAAGNQFWHQDSPGIEGDTEGDDDFGSAVHAVDLDGDGIDDLAVGIPGERTLKIRSGGVDVLFGTPAGLAADDDLLITQEYEYLFDPLEEGDRFGASLATWTQFEFASLLIGAPGDTVNGVPGAGLVEAVGISPWRTIGSTHLLTTDFLLPPQPDDGLGSAIVAADYNGDGYGDLTFGVPFRNFVAADSGVVFVEYPAFFLQLWMQGP